MNFGKEYHKELSVESSHLGGINCLDTVTLIIQLCNRTGTLFQLEILSVVHLTKIQTLVFPPNILHVVF